MEQLNNTPINLRAPQTSRNSFIDANTLPTSLAEIKERHIIPVFAKDGEVLISQSDFIEIMGDCLSNYYQGEIISDPSIRISHPIQGRIPSARNKPLQYLEEHERTIYYDRMMFTIEIPSITEEVGGNPLALTIGGVQAYNQNNLQSRKGADEHFKIFVGFKNTVCTNLKVWSDGLISDLKVTSVGQLKASIKTLLENYNAPYHLQFLRKLVEYSLSERQFAQVIGRSRMYHHLPPRNKSGIKPLLLTDTQLNLVVREYYKDQEFSKGEDESLNLWKLYNLFTGANKSTYIDQFLDKAVNSYEIVEHLKSALDHKTSSWYLN